MIITPTERSELEQALGRHSRYLENELINTFPAKSAAWLDVAKRIEATSQIYLKLVIQKKDYTLIHVEA